MALLVTGTWSNRVLTLDKTAGEIKSAMNSGEFIAESDDDYPATNPSD